MTRVVAGVVVTAEVVVVVDALQPARLPSSIAAASGTAMNLNSVLFI
jgi:hypothetical protein